MTLAIALDEILAISNLPLGSMRSLSSPVVVNEIVLLVQITTNNSNKQKITTNYYFPTINLHNHNHHNAMPITSNYRSDNRQLSNSQDGLSQKQSNNSIEILLGETFKEKDFIKPLRPFEGDNILEGRFGNTIRLGSTSRPLNPWSQNGENSDPIIIIRNGQYNDINDTTLFLIQKI